MSTGATAQPLACARCGAGLPPSPGVVAGGELRCDACGTIHVHERPPAEAINESLIEGQRVLVELGGYWWPAAIVAIRGPGRWRVRVDAWGDEREIGELARLRPHSITPHTNPTDHGLLGLVLGIVIALGVALAVVIVALGQGSGPSTQPPRPSDRADAPSRAPASPQTRPGPIANPSPTRVNPDTPLEVGQPIHLRWRGDWYRAEVAGINEDGSVAVDVLGWPAEYDQANVNRGRIRLP